MSPLCYCYTPRFFTKLHLPTFSERLCNSLEVWHKSVNSNHWQGGNFHKNKTIELFGVNFCIPNASSRGLVLPGRWWSGELHTNDTHAYLYFVLIPVHTLIPRLRETEALLTWWFRCTMLSMFALKLARFPGGGLWHLACLWWRSSPCTVLRSHQGTFCERRRLGDWAPIEDGYLGTQNQPPKKITVAPWPMYPLNGYRCLYNIQNTETETENIWLDHLWKNTVLKTHTPKEGICGCFRVT